MHLARVAYDQARAAGLAANTLRISAQVGTSLLRGAAPWAEAFPVEPPPWVLEALRPVHSSTYLFITVMINQPTIFFFFANTATLSRTYCERSFDLTQC